MQVKVAKLREAMNLLTPVIPGKKATLPVLHNVLLRDGKIAATDLETWVEVVLPEVDLECLIPHSSVTELLKYVPGNEMLTIETDGQLKLSWEGGSSSYPRVKPDEFPVIPKLKVKTQGILDGNQLINAMAIASKYCSSDETRPVLCGVSILPGENLDIAGADGFRMAYQTLTASLPLDKPLIIPPKAVKVLSYLWQHTSPDITPSESLVGLVTQKRKVEVALMEATATGDKLQLLFDDVTVLINLIQGNPPNFKQLIPSEVPTSVQLFPGDLERAIKRVRRIAMNSSGIVRLSWTTDMMTVSAKSEEMGEAEGTLPVHADNPDKVALDIRYLLEYLKGKEGMITMGVTGGTAPVMFRHRASPVVMVMPMNVQW